MENDSMMNEMDAENNEVWTVEGMATCDYLDDVIQKRWSGNACVQDYIESFSDMEIDAIRMYLKNSDLPDGFGFSCDTDKASTISDYIRLYLCDLLREPGYSPAYEDLVWYLKWLDAEKAVLVADGQVN